MTPSRLLFLLHSGVRAGLEEHVLSLLQELSPDHFKLGLACPSELLDSLSTELAALPVDLFPLGPVKWTRPHTVRHLWQALREFRPDILHCHLFRSTLVGAPLARLAGVPIVLETYHGREVWRQGLIKGNFVVDHLVSRCLNHVIAVSEAAAQFLEQSKRIPLTKITVIPNGRDLHAFEPGNETDRHAIRDQWDLPHNGPVLGAVGRLEPQKGLQYLLDACPQILAEFPDTRLLLVGDGNQQAMLAQQADQLGIRDAIIFTGFQNNIPAYIAAIDIMVLPSLYEGMPLTAIETAAMGKPIVATHVDGTPEVVDHGTSGLLVPPRDPAALADAILTLLRQPQLAIQYGEAASIRVRQRFDLRRQVAETEQLYHNLLATQKR